MNPLLGILLICAAAGTFVALVFWLERALRQPGLGFLLTAAVMAIGAALGFANGQKLLPILFLLQVPGFGYSAHLRRTKARTESKAAQ